MFLLTKLLLLTTTLSCINADLAERHGMEDNSFDMGGGGGGSGGGMNMPGTPQDPDDEDPKDKMEMPKGRESLAVPRKIPPKGSREPLYDEYGRRLYTMDGEDELYHDNDKNKEEEEKEEINVLTCDETIGCTYESLGCNLQYEGERLYCFTLNIHGKLYINNLPETLLRLEINDNAITSIDSRTFQPINGKLEVLNAQDNKLIGADLLKMFGTYNATMVFPNITRLDLSGNDFTTVPSTLVQGMPLLKTLYMHSNPKLKKRPDLNNLFKLENVLFDICPGTNVVGCSSVSLGCSSGNGWISCQNKDISGALHLNDDMSNVTHIYLHKNKITTLDVLMFANAPNLQMISLNENQIQSLPSVLFDKIPKLRKLTLEPGNEAILSQHFRCPNQEHRRKKMKVGTTEFWTCEEFMDDL